MVKGKRQAMDSAFIKANASLDSLLEKEVIDDAATYAEELNQRTENKAYAQRMSRLRSATVEPVLGTLINFLNTSIR